MFVMTETSHRDASTGDSGAASQNTSCGAATASSFPSSNPFLPSNTTNYRSPSVELPEYLTINPFLLGSEDQQGTTAAHHWDQPGIAADQGPPPPPLPPRPHPSQFQQHPDDMAATADASTTAIVSSSSSSSLVEDRASSQHHDDGANVADTPEVLTLKSLFPDFDSIVLLSVLQSVDHNQDRAIDVLLGMNDPNYTTQPAPQTTGNNDPASTLALDEQLARQIAQEEEAVHRRRSRHSQEQQPPRAVGQTWSRRDTENQQPPPRQNQGGGGDFQELQETVSRIAETGKRTFSSFVSKVRAKINEFDQGREAQRANNESNQTHPYGSHAPQRDPHIDRHAASEAFAHEYYGAPASAPAPVLNPAAGGWTSTSQSPEVARGYDVSEVQTAQPVSVPPPTASLNVSTPPTSVTPTTVAMSSSSPPGYDVPKPPATNSGNPINPAKLGLLPKRPVVLLSSSPPPNPRRGGDDDEDLEYMENPFEEGRK